MAPKKKTTSARRGVALSGIWSYRGQPPAIRFSVTPGAKGLSVKLSLPKKDLTLPEAVWKAFFRFMALTLHTIRPATVDDKVKEYMKLRHEKRRRRYIRFRHRRNRNPTPKHKKALPPPPVPEDQSVSPTAYLVEVAKAAIQKRRKS
jgi:hypothetical protein